MSAIKTILQQFDGSGDLLEAQREVIETLALLAESKAISLKYQMTSIVAQAEAVAGKTIPISRIIDFEVIVRAFYTTDISKISGEVTGALSALAGRGSGPVIDGIGKLITIRLELFFGQSVKVTDEESSYFIFCTPFNIYRIDVYAFFRDVTAQSIQSKMTKVISVTYAQSTVDVRETTWSNLISIYDAQLRKEDLTEEELETARKEIRDTWNYLRGENGLKQDAD